MLYLLTVLYLSVASAIEVYSGTGASSGTCAPAPERTSKVWKPYLDKSDPGGLNLATGGTPQLTLNVVMDKMYHNATNMGDGFDWFSPRFSYPDFCGSNVPTGINVVAYSHAPGDTAEICEQKYEVNMNYVEFCTFDVTDDAEKYKFSGHMLNEVQYRQTFLGSYVFQKFSRPIGFVVTLPKVLTVTTDIVVINPDQCNDSSDCNNQVCENTTPKICKCDKCHTGSHCQTDICAPQLICPTDFTIDACSKNTLLYDVSGNLLGVADQTFKASDTMAADQTVVGTEPTNLVWAYTVDGVAGTFSSAGSTITESGTTWQQMVEAFDGMDGKWSYPAQTVVKVTVHDVTTNTASCEVKVTVKDTCSARITCSTDKVLTNSLSTLNAASFQGSADDNGLSSHITYKKTAQFSSNPTDGEVNIEFCAQDQDSSNNNINSPTCCSEVYVFDITPPAITCQNLDLNTEDYTNASPETELPLPTRSDAGVGLDGSTFTETALSTTYPTRTNKWTNTRNGNVIGVAVNVFTFSVKDLVGNVNSCTSTVTVRDNLLPKLTCTPVVIDDSNPNYDPDNLFTTADNDAIKQATNHASKEFSWGQHTVATTAVDFHGNTDSLSCTITRKDTTKPTVTCPSTIHYVNMEPTKNYADVTSYVAAILATANDNQQVDTKTLAVNGVATNVALVQLAPTEDDQEFTLVLTITDKQVLTYPVNQQVCTFKVVVNDNENPSVTCPYDTGLKVSTDIGKSCGTPTGPFDAFTATSDNAWYDAASGSYDLSHTACYAFGTSYTVTGTGSDKAKSPANSNTCTFQIDVVDKEAPTLTCADIYTTITHADASPYYSQGIVTYQTPTMHDNVQVDTNTLVYDVPSNSQFKFGQDNTVTATVQDTSGNKGSCTFIVSVQHSCGDGVVNYPTEQCDTTAAYCATDCTCNSATHKPKVDEPGCTVLCAQYDSEGNCGFEEECQLTIITDHYINTVAPIVNDCDFTSTGYSECNIDKTEWDLDAVIANADKELNVIDMVLEWYPYGDKLANTGSEQTLINGEYAEVKVCCNDRPDHALEILVFTDQDNENTYKDSVQDCIERGFTGAAIRPVWQGPGTPAEASLDVEGCFYIPVCSGGVVVIGEKYDAPRIVCNANQPALAVDLTTLVPGSTNCAAVTAPTDLLSRFTITADSDGYVPTATATLDTTDGNCASTTGFDWTVGTYAVKFNVLFASGTNTNGQSYFGDSHYCTFNVVVTDKYDPVFVECPENKPISYDAGKAEATFTPAVLNFRDETAPLVDTVASTPVVTVGGTAVAANADGSYTFSSTAVITWTVYDAAGNDAVCIQTISLSDTEGPVLTCPDATYNTDAGTNTVAAPLPSVTCNDAVSGDCTGAARDSVTFYFQVSIPSGADTGVHYNLPATLSARYITDVNHPYYQSGTMKLGMYAYKATATDSNSNPGSCTGYIFIESNEAPEITCPVDYSIPLSGSTVLVVPTSSQFATSDNDGSEALTMPSSGQTLGCGGSKVFTASVKERLHWLTKTQLTDTCTYTVSANDVSDPTISCPSTVPSVNVECPSVGCSSDAEWDKNVFVATTTFWDSFKNSLTTTDNCDTDITITLDTTSQAQANWAISSSHSVTFTASDDSTNDASTSCTFSVVDKIPPRYTSCPADSIVYSASFLPTVGAGYQYDLTTDENSMEWTDNVGVNSVDFVSATDSNGNSVTLTSKKFSPAPGETYTFKYTAVDTAGNAALTACSWTFKLVDNKAPTVSCPQNAVFEATGSVIAYSYSGAVVTTSDDYTAAGSLTATLTSLGATLPATVVDGKITLGTYQLPTDYAMLPYQTTFTAEVADAYNNKASCSWTVKIQDTTAPSIDCSTVADVSARPLNAATSVIVNYPSTLGFSVSDIHAKQALLDATVSLNPVSGSSYTYSSTGTNSYPVALTVTDDQTTPNLNTTNSACFNIVILEPYPFAEVAAALKSVRITADANDDFFADIVFVTGVNWPHTVYLKTGQLTDAVISYPGSQTRADQVVNFETRITGSVQAPCASSYTTQGFGVGSNCLQEWFTKIKFSSCDAVDMKITLSFKSVCDNEGNGYNDCSLSANHDLELTLAAEDYCTKQLADVDVEAKLTTYSSTSTDWTTFYSTAPSYDTDSVIVDFDDIPTESTSFDPNAQVVALITVTSTQAIISKVVILKMQRTQCTDAGLTQCEDASTIISRTSKDDTNPVYNVPSTSDETLKNNFAYFRYTEVIPPLGTTLYMKLDATVSIEYRLTAGGARRRTTLELQVMEANYPENIRHLMPKARRRMAQAPALETNAEATGRLALNYAIPTGKGNGSKKSGASGSDSDLPAYVIPAVIAVIVLALCAACGVGGCCYYIGMKKRKAEQDFLNEKIEHTSSMQTNIYMSPQQPPSRRV